MKNPALINPIFSITNFFFSGVTKYSAQSKTAKGGTTAITDEYRARTDMLKKNPASRP